MYLGHTYDRHVTYLHTWFHFSCSHQDSHTGNSQQCLYSYADSYVDQLYTRHDLDNDKLQKINF